MFPSCPTLELLADYLAGRLPPHQAEQVERHLPLCPACIDRVDGLKVGSDAIVRAIRWPNSVDALVNEPELSSALGAIENLQVMPHTAVPPLPQREVSAALWVRDYQLFDKLGEGGMGTVYRALHTRLEKTVALKILKPDRQQQTQAVQRFEREMKALGSLEHPNIVRALDAGEDQGIHFLVMEFIEGVDLAKLIDRLGALAVADACELVRQAALGVGHAHRHEKVHRDVKPGNLILSREGVVKLLDLGLAQFCNPLAEGDMLTREDQVLGTRAYMSPEQLVGAKHVTQATDIYSLGVTFYHLLAGQLPLKPGQFALQLPPLEKLRPDLPQGVQRIVQWMLSEAIETRLASMVMVAELLQPHAAGANLAGLFQHHQHVRSQAARTSEHLSPAISMQPTELFSNTTARRPAAEAVNQSPSVAVPLPSTQLVAVPQPAPRRQLATAVGVIGTACVAAVVLMAMLFSPAEPATGKLTFQTTSPELQTAIQTGNSGLYAIGTNAANAERRWRLVTGENDLPTGEYRLETSLDNLTVHWNGKTLPATQFKFIVQPGIPLSFDLSQVQPQGILNLKLGGSLLGVLDDKHSAGIFAIPRAAQDSTAGIRLQEGDNHLPVGEYRLATPAWMLEFTVNGQAAPPRLTVKPDRPLYVGGMVRTDFPWSLPAIPTEQGAFAESYGTVWRASANNAAKEQTYDLRLTLRNEVEVAGVPHRWLEVEVRTTQAGEKYLERGLLLIDVTRYRQLRQLSVARGWIEAQSPKLGEQMKSLFPDAQPESLVVAFDPQRDALADMAERQRLVFPVDRVSLQEAMSLLFEADFAGGLPLAVQELRPQLATHRKLYFESINGAFGAEDCLVIRAQTQPPGPVARYELVRAQNVPFGFVSIEVHSPVFRGKFMLKDYNARPAAGVALANVDEVALTAAARTFAAGTSAPQRFDLVSLPREGGAKVRYTGRIVTPVRRPTLPSTEPELASIDFDVELWVGAAQEIDGVQHRPIAIVVESAAQGAERSTEKAWLWIDEERYLTEFRFAPHADRSFVELGGAVFPFTRDDAAVLEDLHRLNQIPRDERLGIYDALALLFGAESPAARKFTALRAAIARAVIASGAERKREAIQITLPAGGETWGELWQPPLGKIAYRIHRTRHLPFGIFRVYLQQPAIQFEITAEAKAFTSTDAPSIVGDDAWWQQHAQRTLDQIAAIKPGNFRLWKARGGSVVAWAEYLADARGRVVLRKADGELVVRAVDELAPDQVANLRVRTWTLRDGQTLHGQFSNQTAGKWWLRLHGPSAASEGSERAFYSNDPERFSKADAEWVIEHEKALRNLAK